MRPNPCISSPRRPVWIIGTIAVSLLVNITILVALRSSPADVPPPTTEFRPSTSIAANDIPDLWSHLDRADPSEFVARLRSVGLNEELVRAIAWQRLKQPSAFESAEVRNAPYWRRSAIISDVNQRRSARVPRGEDRPDVAAFKAIFGERPAPSFPAPDFASVRNAMRRTPPRVAQVVSELMAARTAQLPKSNRSVLINGQPDANTLAARTQRDQAQAQFETGLHEMLTPEEYADYLRYEGRTAHFLRNNIDGLILSQTEFDTLTTLLENVQNFRRELPQYANQLRDAIGEERYAELAQAITGNTAANRLVERLGLPFSSALALQSVQDDFSARGQVISRDRSLLPEERTARLAVLGAEALDQLAAILGAEGLELYTIHAADWMNQFPPVPETPGP